jgi:uncharacterized protein (DUF2141 family)
MKQAIIFILLASAFHCQDLFSQSTPTGTLEIHFTNLRSDKGSMAIGINTSAKGWPRKAEKELQFKKTQVKDRVFVVRIPNMPFGTMAISVLDDENSNIKMDMSITGPKEGYGFSNDAPIRGLSPPKFEDCSFEFNRDNQKISIQLRYRGKDK